MKRLISLARRGPFGWVYFKAQAVLQVTWSMHTSAVMRVMGCLVTVSSRQVTVCFLHERQTLPVRCTVICRYYQCHPCLSVSSRVLLGNDNLNNGNISSAFICCFYHCCFSPVYLKLFWDFCCSSDSLEIPVRSSPKWPVMCYAERDIELFSFTPILALFHYPQHCVTRPFFATQFWSFSFAFDFFCQYQCTWLPGWLSALMTYNMSRGALNPTHSLTVSSVTQSVAAGMHNTSSVASVFCLLFVSTFTGTFS